MFVDVRSAPIPAVPSNAVIIVGSGAAGLALAEYLDTAGRPVVLVESGPAGYDESRPADDLNVGDSVGVRYAGLSHGRTRVLGGSTQLWHGQCMRLHDIDLRTRSWVPGSGWPMALTDLDRYYTRAEAWLGVSGLGYGPSRWSEHPRLTPAEWDAEHLLNDFTEYTPNPMLGPVHRRRFEARPGVRILVNATVTRVLTSGVPAEGGTVGTVRGVEIATPDGHRHDLLAADVVLAAGAIENARLLQLSDQSGVGLGTGRAHTGRYLQDHPVIRTAEVRSTDPRYLQERYVALHKGRRRLFPKVRLAPRAQERHGLVDATAVFVHDFDQPSLEAARRLLLDARARRRPQTPWRDLRTALRAPGPVVRDSYRRYARGLTTGARPSRVWLQIWLEQVPDPASRVALGRDVDRLGCRQAEVDWRIDDREIETSRQMTRWIGADLERLGVGRLHDLPAMGDDEAWRDTVTDAFHPSGTTRMSRDPHAGVVDPDLQVHGVVGLHVVGGSVFPVAGYANPTLTIVALALRLGDRLAPGRPRP